MKANKNPIEKIMITAGAVLVTVLSLGAATPQVKNVNAFQLYPWEAKIYISYEVEGSFAASSGSGNAPILFITAKDKTSGEIYGGVSSGLSFLTGDTGASSGLHKVVWDVAAQGVTINSANVVFTVVYYYPYMVVDLSSGASSSKYPISGLSAVPSGGWTDEYKTTKLVLRCVNSGTYKMMNISNVTLTKPFYIGIFEVTQRQYELVMGANPSNFRGDMLPVEQVSYNMIRGSSNGAKWPSSSAVDSTSFMGKLRARTGLDFDLPTEAQWEYACRSGTTTRYYWGDSMNGNYAWYADNSSSTTHEVGTKKPNAWGLYDMIGNVWETCLDFDGTRSYGIDPKGPEWDYSNYRRHRGGCWSTTGDHLGSTASDIAVASWTSSGRGFRLVRTLSGQ